VFRGERSVQLTWEDARERRKEAPDKEEPSAKVIDHRSEGDKASLLRKLAQREGAQVLLEATSLSGLKSKDRNKLSSCTELVVGTIPPSRRVLEDVLETYEPEVLYVVGVDPEVDTLQGFTRRLLGAAKHAIKTEKTPLLSQLAVTMAHEERTVREGLKWLAGRGQIQFFERKTGVQTKNGVQAGGDTTGKQPTRGAPDHVRQALEEAGAFRKYAFSDTRPANQPRGAPRK